MRNKIREGLSYTRDKLETVLIPEVLYRLRTLIRGAIGKEELNQMLNQEFGYSVSRSSWYHLKRRIWMRELSAYIIARDIWMMREMDDPFIDSPIILQYEDEFRKFAETQAYQPAGMVNTALLVIYSMIRHTRPKVIIESGTKHGYSSVFIAEALQKNGSNCSFYCLSLFERGEYQNVLDKLSSYPFVTIMEGHSENLIDKVIEKHANDEVAILIDGPKARSVSCDVFTQKICDNFCNLLFLCFDAAQEHVPFYLPYVHSSDLKRNLNIERLKLLHLYQTKYRDKGYSLTIQSNQFCRKYACINDSITKYRNEHWGQDSPWQPYCFDRIKNHVAFTYKLGMIYRSSIL